VDGAAQFSVVKRIYLHHSLHDFSFGKLGEHVQACAEVDIAGKVKSEVGPLFCSEFGSEPRIPSNVAHSSCREESQPRFDGLCFPFVAVWAGDEGDVWIAVMGVDAGDDFGVWISG
jgi:hypothetical protein